MIYLLDANVLISLIDPDHVHSDYAKAWFEQTIDEGWATCPITQHAFMRITGKPSYGMQGNPSEMADILKRVCKRPGHVFWPENISLLTSPLVDTSRLTSHGQITDTYLLALAVQNGGRLATFDRRLSTSAVEGGREALHIIQTTA
ncbi:TA system VapC family ribonuclease toxin [Brevundimonas sp.]